MRSIMTKGNTAGFTLVEVLVVIGTISILAGIALPSYNSYKEKAKTAEAMQDLKRIETAIIALGTDTGQWPEHQVIGAINNGGGNEIYDLSDSEVGLIADDAGNPYPNWNGPYIPSIPLDPWGHKYFLDTDYQINGTDFIVLGSFGTGSVCNNCYNDTDIRLIIPKK